MERRVARMALLPATMVILLATGIWTAVLVAQHDDPTRFFDPERQRHIDVPRSEDELDQRYAQAIVPWQVGVVVAAPLGLWSLVDLERRWGETRPARWPARHHVVAAAVPVVAGSLAVAAWLRYVSPDYIRLLVFMHAAGAIVVYLAAVLSIAVGSWAAGSVRMGLPSLRRPLAWALGGALFLPLLTMIVLIPDPTSADLLRVTAPATIVMGMAAAILWGTHRTSGHSA